MFEPKNRPTSYVGSYYDFKSDAVIIWERDLAGNRVVKPYPAPYYFYVPDPDGGYTALTGEKLKRLDFEGRDDYQAGLARHNDRFESDYTPLFRVLMDEYYGSAIPQLNYALLDIETDYSVENGGFATSSPECPEAPINAVTLWQSWKKEYITAAVLPKILRKSFNRAKFDNYVQKISKAQGLFATPNVQILKDEGEILELIIKSIDDADLISGWNSQFFDLPYIIKRMERVKPRLVPRMCFTGCRPPKERTVEQFGTPQITYQLNGRTHLDYLDMFKKFTFGSRPSYSLGAITGDELDAPKLEHEGTLEQLYKGEFFPNTDGFSWDNVDAERPDILENLTMRRSLVLGEIQARQKGESIDAYLQTLTDSQLEELAIGLDDDVRHCSFAMFCCYNTHDVGCLVGLDEKFKFVALVNQMAHENTCRFEDIMGTVRYVETGMTNRGHYFHKKVVMDKRVMTDGEKVEGALVLNPLAGLHKWLGSVDITSLYPSVIRSLSISPELFIGQFTTGETAWRGVMNGDDDLYTLRDDAGETVTMTGFEWQELFYSNKWVVTAYGTVFDQSSGPGIVNETITFWFAERKRLKKEMDNWQKKRKELVKDNLYHLDIADYERYKAGDEEFSELRDMVSSGEIFNHETGFYTKEVYDAILHAIVQVEHFDLLQLTKKIQLNSAYGALLSPHFRFGRKEMGASVTACGRQITTFMIEQIGELLTGGKINVIKSSAPDKDGRLIHQYTTDSDVILLSDTDSCYFKTGADNKEDAIRIADNIGETVNSMFPAFMKRAFFCNPSYDDLIKASREVVGSAGLFLPTKKRYTIKVVNLDGYDLEVPKLKTMGSEMKKADTPKVIQKFLKDLMNLILDGHPYEEVEAFVNKARGQLIRGVKNPVSLGAAKQINNLDAKYAEWTRTEKQTGEKMKGLPGHVRAAINYNELAQEYAPGEATLLKAGDKGMVFYLAPNPNGLATIAFPADMTTFPKWFTENFKIDRKATESKMIDAKIERIFETLGWDIPTPQKTKTKKLLNF